MTGTSRKPTDNMGFLQRLVSNSWRLVAGRTEIAQYNQSSVGDYHASHHLNQGSHHPGMPSGRSNGFIPSVPSPAACPRGVQMVSLDTQQHQAAKTHTILSHYPSNLQWVYLQPSYSLNQVPNSLHEADNETFIAFS